MPSRQLQSLMWADACAAIERAERVRRQFFHREHSEPCWEAPVDVFESADGLTILVALPGVERDRVQVTLNDGVLTVSGERPLPEGIGDHQIRRLEIPHGHFRRRIELPAVPLEISGRHLANGCLMLRLTKLR